jgi:hypothetical protein
MKEKFEVDYHLNENNSIKLSVPVLPYNMEMPNNNNPDEKADEMIILNAASDERLFSRSKFQCCQW